MTTELKPCPFCGGEAAFGYIRFTAEIYRPDGTQREDGHFVSCIRCGSSNQGVCCGYDTQDKALELWNRRAEQASQPQWIPVSEQLPPEGEPVLIWMRPETVPDSIHNVIVSNPVFARKQAELGFVTHWMPLPAVPKAIP